jgi:hypothetical protein
MMLSMVSCSLMDHGLRLLNANAISVIIGIDTMSKPMNISVQNATSLLAYCGSVLRGQARRSLACRLAHSIDCRLIEHDLMSLDFRRLVELVDFHDRALEIVRLDRGFPRRRAVANPSM